MLNEICKCSMCGSAGRRMAMVYAAGTRAGGGGFASTSLHQPLSGLRVGAGGGMSHSHLTVACAPPSASARGGFQWAMLAIIAAVMAATAAGVGESFLWCAIFITAGAALSAALFVRACGSSRKQDTEHAQRMAEYGRKWLCSRCGNVWIV